MIHSPADFSFESKGPPGMIPGDDMTGLRNTIPCGSGGGDTLYVVAVRTWNSE